MPHRAGRESSDCSLVVANRRPARSESLLVHAREWFQWLVAPAKSSALLAETSSEAPAVLLLVSNASSDHPPGPFTSRNKTVSICAYSDRTSCNTAQNPACGGTGGRGKGDVPKYNEIFVERIATI